jgi:hypothetical protein
MSNDKFTISNNRRQQLAHLFTEQELLDIFMAEVGESPEQAGATVVDLNQLPIRLRYKVLLNFTPQAQASGGGA